MAAYLQRRDIDQAIQQADANRGQNAPRQPVTTAADLPNILPPLLYVERPDKEDSRTTQDTLRIKAVALSHSLPITDVQVTLNGVLIAGKPGDRPKGPTLTRVVEIEAPLQPGNNRLSIVAVTDKAQSAPEVRTIVYTPSSESKAGDVSKPDLILLAIGIAHYQAPGLQLSFADADARDLVKIFEQQKGKSFGNVRTKLLVNEEATREAILTGLGWLSEEESPNAIRVLFLSGHGDTDKSGTYFFLSHQHDPKEKYLELRNVNWSMLLNRLVAGSGKKILMVDTCRAAAATGTTTPQGKVDFNQVLKETDPLRYSIVTFAASRGVEIAVENAAWQHGAFTKVLLDGLSGQADTDENSAVDTDELGSWMIAHVRKLTDGKQNPLYYSLPDTKPFRLSVRK